MEFSIILSKNEIRAHKSMYSEDVSWTDKSLTTKIGINHIEFDMRKHVNIDVRHLELEVCEVEKSEITPLYHVTYEVEDEGNKVDIEFEDVIRV